MGTVPGVKPGARLAGVPGPKNCGAPGVKPGNDGTAGLAIGIAPGVDGLATGIAPALGLPTVPGVEPGVGCAVTGGVMV